MIRPVLVACWLITLTGCAVAPPQAYTFDPTHPQPKPIADAAKVAPLTNDVAQLQLQLNEVRAQIAAEPDARKRIALYERENLIHRRLGPLQRDLAQYASAR